MKKIISSLLLLCCINYAAYGQDLVSKINGSWLYKGVYGKKLYVECPDMLVFNKDGTYAILNDCYGKDIKYPVIEKGKWNFNSKSMIITLDNRKDYTNYIFHNNGQILTLLVKEIANAEMRICIYSHGDCILEEYEKK